MFRERHILITALSDFVSNPVVKALFKQWEMITGKGFSVVCVGQDFYYNNLIARNWAGFTNNFTN